MRAAALQPSPSSETQPDGFAEVLEARLQLSVPPPSTPTGPPMLEHIGAKKKPGTSQLVLDNGDELQLFRRRPWLGEGAHAKVVAGILTTAAVPGQPAGRELVRSRRPSCASCGTG